MYKKYSYLSNSSQETVDIAQEVAASLKSGDVVCLFGDLAAGKTTFLKGLISNLPKSIFDDKWQPVDASEVQSPTFGYLNIYGGSPAIFHFDLYRLTGPEQFLHMGFDEYFEADGICFVEWAERIKKIIPKNALLIHLEHLGGNKRLISLNSLAEGFTND